MNSRNSKVLVVVMWIVYILIQFACLPARVALYDKYIIVGIAFLAHILLCRIVVGWVWERTIDKEKPYLYLLYALIFGALSAYIVLTPLFYFFGNYNIEFISQYNPLTMGVWMMVAYLMILATTAIKMLNRISLYSFLGINAKNSRLAELDALSAQGNKSLILNHMNDILSNASGNEEETVERMRKHVNMISHLYSNTYEEELLTKEIQFLVDYNELCIQKEPELKYSVNFDFDGDIEVKRIIPLVLFPFYEKAMYYIGIKPEESQIKSLVYGESNFIRFQIFADKPKILQIDTSFLNDLDTRITSAKRRLMEAYPDSHELIINENEKHYNVFLRINIK